jgi:hypothetical protein
MIRYEEYIRKFAEEFADRSIIEPEDFPDMELYPDQAAEFINSKLSIYGDNLITKSEIHSFVKQGLVGTSDKKRFNKEQMVLIELLLCLRMSYKKEDLEKLMTPFQKDKKADFNDGFDFYEIYKELVPAYKEQRREAVDRTLDLIDKVKNIMKSADIEDDDSMEMFLILLSIAIEVDTSMYIGKRLLRDRFAE